MIPSYPLLKLYLEFVTLLEQNTPQENGFSTGVDEDDLYPIREFRLLYLS